VATNAQIAQRFAGLLDRDWRRVADTERGQRHGWLVGLTVENAYLEFAGLYALWGTDLPEDLVRARRLGEPRKLRRICRMQAAFRLLPCQ